jgi:Carboxypeptidase regulatory-like domain/TonB dependent receptor/TonB-dependent Receptor Plug Domain
MRRRDAMKVTRIIAVSMMLFSGLFAAVAAYSQVTGATLTGTVTDPSGATVPGAQISVKNNATGVMREVTSDSSGFYTVPNVIPGDYEVTVSAKGFSTAKQSSLSLAVGQQQQLNFSLKVGETSQTVEVTGAAPQIELTSSALTGQVESETVRELPLNGRDWTSLATLQPGVKKIETQVSYSDAGRGARGFGSELTVSGQRSTFNNYRIDGVTVVDYANSAPGNVIGVVLGVDAIQEFSVLTGGFPAEYGRATGGVVNAISKSGTNSFHGDVYEFLRNNALDANDYFTKSAGNPRPTFRRNQFGGSAGGPIIKDKTFIFGDYEGLRQSKGIPSVSNVPSDAARGGTLQYDPTMTLPFGCTPVTPATNPPTCTVPVNDYSAALLALYPHANAAISGNSGKFIFGGVQIVPENFYTVRVDHILGANDRLFGTYLYDDTDYKQPDSMDDVLTNSHTTRTTVAIEENHTFSSSFTNVARIGYNRDHVRNIFTPTAISAAGGSLALGAVAGQAAPRLGPMGGISSPFFGGTNASSHNLFTWNSYQAYDDAFWVHGTHTIKFGVGVERMQFNEHTFQEPGGLYKFADYAHFLEGIPNSFEAELPIVDQPREFRQTLVAAYVQDDWKMRSNLTVNIGLRYEMTTVLKDAQNRLTNLADITGSNIVCARQFTAPVPAQAGSSCGSVGPYYSNPTLRNFEPRIGFAWDPFKDGKTSLRGSFGIYDVLLLPGYFLLQQNQASPFLIFKSIHGESNFTPQTGFATPFEAGEGGVQLVNSTSSNLSVSTVEAHPHRNYVMEWNLNIQRQLTSDLSLTVGYIGSRGVHMLLRGDDGNMTLPTLTSAGYLFPCGPPILADGSCTAGNSPSGPPTGTSAQINPNLGAIRYMFWNTDSRYHGLNVNLEKRFAHGLQFQVAYTFAKSLDDDSQTIAGDTFGNGINSPWWFLPKLFYGPSDFNVTHDVSINALYDIPTPKSLTGIANTLLGGWELGGILSYNSGVPTTPINNGDPLGLGNTGADQFGPLVKVPGCDPINHGFANSLAGAPLWINANCYTSPTAPASFQGQCADFPGAPTPPAGRIYCANLAPGNVLRNSIYGPHLFTMDFSILKNFPVKRISEQFNVQFRAEMFNITNHDNFVPPQPNSGDGNSGIINQDGSNAGLGTISLLATTPREIQFALKVIW